MRPTSLTVVASFEVGVAQRLPLMLPFPCGSANTEEHGLYQLHFLTKSDCLQNVEDLGINQYLTMLCLSASSKSLSEGMDPLLSTETPDSSSRPSWKKGQINQFTKIDKKPFITKVIYPYIFVMCAWCVLVGTGTED